MARIFLGTGGVFTPRQGCSAVSWSLNAVVKIADRIAKQDRITVGETPAFFMSVTHSRTSTGRISIRRMVPNTGRMCSPR